MAEICLSGLLLDDESPELTSYLDTHVAIFLHSGNVARLSRRAEDESESTGLLVSAMVMFEIEMLYEKNAVAFSAAQILSDLNLQLGLSVCQLPMAVVVGSALAIQWTREPGDRMIVAQHYCQQFGTAYYLGVRYSGAISERDRVVAAKPGASA